MYVYLVRFNNEEDYFFGGLLFIFCFIADLDCCQQLNCRSPYKLVNYNNFQRGNKREFFIENLY
jgi:hypothetical protein